MVNNDKEEGSTNKTSS